jgi:hypothetical protein
MLFKAGGEVDFTKSGLLTLERNVTNIELPPQGLNPGDYEVYFYDIDYDRTLSEYVRYPAASGQFSVTQGKKSVKNNVVFSLSFVRIE